VTYAISLLPAARRQLSRLDPEARRRVGALIDSLAAEPRPAGVKALKGNPACCGRGRVTTEWCTA
jgi:mRNA interferase RelE/StbE